MAKSLTITVSDELFTAFRSVAGRECRSVEGHLMWLMKRAVRARVPEMPLTVAGQQERLRRNAQVLAELRRLHTRTGKPSTRVLADITRSQGTAVSHSTVHTALSGKAPPAWPTLEALVNAMHGDVEHFRELWTAANE